MKRIQKYIAMGASLIIACLLTVAGVLAAGSITTTITVNIHHDGSVMANVRVGTYSNVEKDGENYIGNYFQLENTTLGTFNTEKSALIFNNNGGTYQENTDNLDAFLDIELTNNENTFKFTDAGELKFFFLIENLAPDASLTYTIKLSYGAGENPSETPTGNYEVVDTLNMTDIFLINKQGETTAKSLCTVSFKVKNINEDFTGIDEQINIDIILSKAKAAPVTLEFEDGDVENSVIRMATTSANTAGAYYQDDSEGAITAGNFETTNSALVFNGTEQTSTITTLIKSDNFRFDADGNLKLYLLFENSDVDNTLTYTITLTYGDGATSPTNFTFDAVASSPLSNVTMLQKMGADPTKSLCTLVFSLNAGIDANALYNEKINIKIELSRAEAEPVEFVFEGEDITNSVIRMATTSANTDGAYYQDDTEGAITIGDFNTTNSVLLFNGTEQTATITTLIRSDNFRFDANGNLKLYLLFENSDAENTLTYTITLTYGDDATSPTNFTFNSTDSSALTEVIAVGSSGTPTKSLCTLVFSSATANALYNEKININISLVKTVVEHEP